MTIETVSIICDVGLPDGSEFAASQIGFTLSGPDYDTASNDSIPAMTVTVDLDGDGVATAELWPVDRGTRNTHYQVVLIGSRTVNGRVVAEQFTLGTIRPPSGGSHDLADLLAQSSGGIVVGSMIYDSLADAVAAARAAAARAVATSANGYGFLTVADLLADSTLGYAAGASRQVGAGDYFMAGGYSYAVLASDATGADITTAGGVKLQAVEAVALPAIAAGLGGDDTAKLNAWLQEGGTLKPQRNHTYRFSGLLTIPAGAVIDGELRLVYEGANDVALLSVGNNVILDRLRLEVPTATGVTASIGTGYRGGEIHVDGAGNGGSSFLTIPNTDGLDLDRFDCDGGFQRPLVLGNASAWSAGGRLGYARIRNFTRGIAINYLDGFTLGGFDIGEKSAVATYSPGHNGILATGLRNSRIGAGRIQGAGEHALRLSGSDVMGASYNVDFGLLTVDGPGGCVVKVNADARARDLRFAGLNAVGRFASAPGGNREFIRLSHCQDVSFGLCMLTVGEGSSFAAQDAISLNDAENISVAHMHADGLGQSVVDCVSGQDTGEGLGNGDVRNVFVGGLTGTDANSKVIVRFAMATGFEASGIHIAGMDYSSDGPLVTASPTTVVDGPCSISGRLRKTDLTALPSTTNLPANVAVDVMIGDMQTINVSGTLIDARLPLQPYTNRAAVVAALASIPPVVQRVQWVTPRGDTVAVMRKAGSTKIADMPGWVPDGVTTPEHYDGSLLAALAGSSRVLADGDYGATGLSVTGGATLQGVGSVTRTGGANILTSAAADDVHVSGMSLNMNRATVPGDGQGISLSGDRVRVDGVTVSGFSRMASGGGTGVLVYSSDLLDKSREAVLEDLRLIGHTSTSAAETFGWILADVDYSRVAHVYAENIYGTATAYAHELKNTSSWNNLHALTTKVGIFGYGHGQQDAGLPGPVGNVGWGIVNAQCDRGILVADGKWNLIGGSVTDWDGSPQKISRMGLYGAENEEGGLFPDHLVHGAGAGVGVHLRNGCVRNYVSAAIHTPDAANMVEFVHADTRGNFVEILHTGTAVSVLPLIADATGNGFTGPNANVVHSPSTGERVGSRSGYFHDRLGSSGGATPLSSARWRYEFDSSFRLGGMTPTGEQFGLDHSTPARTSTGAFYHVSNATATNEYWEMRTGGVNIVRWFGSVMRAVTDAAYDLGSAAFKFREVFAVRFRPGGGTVVWTSGAGTPEGTVTAVVGSMYTRTDGGAGTTLYVKESGTGNTGWVAK